MLCYNNYVLNIEKIDIYSIIFFYMSKVLYVPLFIQIYFYSSEYNIKQNVANALQQYCNTFESIANTRNIVWQIKQLLFHKSVVCYIP